MEIVLQISGALVVALALTIWAGVRDKKAAAKSDRRMASMRGLSHP